MYYKLLDILHINYRRSQCKRKIYHFVVLYHISYFITRSAFCFLPYSCTLLAFLIYHTENPPIVRKYDALEFFAKSNFISIEVLCYFNLPVDFDKKSFLWTVKLQYTPDAIHKCDSYIKAAANFTI